jgi:hypothetical protein
LIIQVDLLEDILVAIDDLSLKLQEAQQWALQNDIERIKKLVKALGVVSIPEN